ncbi:FAD-dependent monooxygenase [Achromobacter denitrificans]|uniref:FAD-dependent monooxygenase n=1 Tax=Achromobacter denitrificans TaxID=32002 RepID=UPI0023E769B1|nr:FAD-dependent monooxygenase [Achromobacter denitrificans]MDF3941675.1 FAD-dependent monooxygenase [Achromobacter denitrificans]
MVHPRSLELFDSLGIVEPLLAAGVRQCGARIHANGEILGEIDLDLCGSRYPYNIGISEETTEAILADYLAAQGGAVQRATKLVGLEETEGGMLATLEQPDGRATVLAQWVVGCDGHHSTVRELAGIPRKGTTSITPIRPSSWATGTTRCRRASGCPTRSLSASRRAARACCTTTPAALAIPCSWWAARPRPSRLCGKSVWAWRRCPTAPLSRR